MIGIGMPITQSKMERMVIPCVFVALTGGGKESSTAGASPFEARFARTSG